MSNRFLKKSFVLLFDIQKIASRRTDLNKKSYVLDNKKSFCYYQRCFLLYKDLVLLSIIFPIIGVLLIGISKAGFAAGLGMISTPLIATVLPARETIGIILPLLCMTDLFTICIYRFKWKFEIALRILVGALPGILFGILVIEKITDHGLKIGIGIITLVFVGILFIRQHWLPHKHYSPPIWHSILIGLIAGFTSTLAHAAGPIIAIFLLSQQLDKQTFVATSAIYYTIGNLLKIPPYIASGVLNMEIFRKALFFFPVIPVAVLLGWWANKHIPQKIFNHVVYIILTATALKLIFFST